MSKALPGEHYCLLHQGNHSHYATHNCTVCKLQALAHRVAELNPNAGVIGAGMLASLVEDARRLVGEQQ
jgi:hypothetical protein